MADELKASPRNPYLGALSDAMGYVANPTFQGQPVRVRHNVLTDVLPLESGSNLLNRLSYGEPLTTGAGGIGGTSRPVQEAVDMALDLQPFAGDIARGVGKAGKFAGKELARAINEAHLYGTGPLAGITPQVQHVVQPSKLVSAVDKTAAELPRAKGTGKEFMTELSKKPGVKKAELSDRNLHEINDLPKMTKEQFQAELDKRPKPEITKKILGKHPDTDEYYTMPQDDEGIGDKHYVMDANHESVTRHPFDTLADAEEHIRKLQDESSNVHHEDFKLPGGENYQEHLYKYEPEGQEPFVARKEHFGAEPNVLASARTVDRRTPEGKKILHVEEIQSDWHQRGRDEGYHEAGEEGKKHNEFEVYSKELAKKYGLNPNQNLAMYATMKGMDPSEVAKYEQLQNALIEAKNRVPDAPFKKNWEEMVGKDLVKHAIDNGYDAIALTNGETQADRYNLGKYINELHLSGSDLVGYDHDGNTVIKQTGVTPENLNQYVGKKAAKKLLDQPQQGTLRSLTGEDLYLGEGMKEAYDKRLPNVFNDIGKPYGAEMKLNELPVRKEAKYYSQMHDNGFGVFQEGENNELVSNHPTLEEANLKAKELNSTPLHYMEFTPEMKQSVATDSLPAYADGGQVEQPGFLNPSIRLANGQVTLDPLEFMPNYDVGGVVKSLATPNNISRMTDIPYLGEGVQAAKEGKYGDAIGSVVNTFMPTGAALATYSPELNPNEASDLSKTQYVQGHHGRQQRTWSNGMATGGKVKHNVHVSDDLDMMRHEIMTQPVHRFKDGGQDGEDLSKPAFVYPTVVRKPTAPRGDVNTLPDPKTYAAVSGFLGTPPDEQGFSVLHPDLKGIKTAGDIGYATGLGANVLPLVGGALKLAGEGANARLLSGKSLMPGMLAEPKSVLFAKEPKIPEGLRPSEQDAFRSAYESIQENGGVKRDSNLIKAETQGEEDIARSMLNNPVYKALGQIPQEDIDNAVSMRKAYRAEPKTTPGSKAPESEWVDWGKKYGVDMSVSPDVHLGIKDPTTGRDVVIPGGLEGKFTIPDLFKIKANNIDPNALPKDVHDQLMQKFIRTHKIDNPDQVDMFNRLNFALLSPNAPLTPNEFLAQRARLVNMKELEALAGRVDEIGLGKTADKQLGVGSAQRGGMGVKGTADLENQAQLAKVILEKPEMFQIQPGETMRDVTMRVMNQIPGLGPKTASLGTPWLDLEKANTSAVDLHMIRHSFKRLLDDPEVGDAFKERMATLLKTKPTTEAILAKDPKEVEKTAIGVIGGTSKQKMYRLKTGELNDIPSVATPEKLHHEPSVFQEFNPFYNKVVDYVDESRGQNPILELFPEQWRKWDMYRQRIEPHEFAHPDFRKLPRQSWSEMAESLQNHKDAGYTGTKPVMKQTDWRDLYYGHATPEGMGALLGASGAGAAGLAAYKYLDQKKKGGKVSISDDLDMMRHELKTRG